MGKWNRHTCGFVVQAHPGATCPSGLLKRRSPLGGCREQEFRHTNHTPVMAAATPATLIPPGQARAADWRAPRLAATVGPGEPVLSLCPGTPLNLDEHGRLLREMSASRVDACECVWMRGQHALHASPPGAS